MILGLLARGWKAGAVIGNKHSSVKSLEILRLGCALDLDEVPTCSRDSHHVLYGWVGWPAGVQGSHVLRST